MVQHSPGAARGWPGWLGMCQPTLAGLPEAMACPPPTVLGVADELAGCCRPTSGPRKVHVCVDEFTAAPHTSLPSAQHLRTSAETGSFFQRMGVGSLELTVRVKVGSAAWKQSAPGTCGSGETWRF